jgi:hypothetical protein
MILRYKIKPDGPVSYTDRSHRLVRGVVYTTTDPTTIGWVKSCTELEWEEDRSADPHPRGPDAKDDPPPIDLSTPNPILLTPNPLTPDRRVVVSGVPSSDPPDPIKRKRGRPPKPKE